MKNFKIISYLPGMKCLCLVCSLFCAAVYLTACGDSPITPIGGEGEKPGVEASNFGLVEVTISGIGTEKMSATVQPYVSNIAGDFSRLSGSGGPNDGTIQLKSASNGSFTVGERGDGGMRYIWATFRVRNADKDGNLYSSNRENLTFLAVDTPDSYRHTAVTGFRLFDGTVLPHAEAELIAKATIPTGASKLAYEGRDVKVRSRVADVLQLFTESQVQAIDLTGTTATDVFPYGFITKNVVLGPSGNRRLSLSAFNGLVTFAFKLPLQSQADQDPFEVSMVFLPVDDSETTITQSFEEQNANGREAFLKRVRYFNPAPSVKILPGSTYRGPATVLCSPVRITGTDAAPGTELFAPLPGLASLQPDPYGIGAQYIQAGQSFTVNFDGDVSEATSRHFVIRGSQSGLRTDAVNTNPPASSIVAYPGSFFAGEIVEVSVIRGYGNCEPTVARYRVEASGGSSGNFTTTFPISFPNSDVDLPNVYDLSIGDVNDNGKLDIVMAVGGINAQPGVTIAYGRDDGTFYNLDDYRFYNVPNGGTLAIGDLNEDGAIDIVGGYGYGNMSILLNTGSSNAVENFDAARNVEIGISNDLTIELGDMNGDGALDVVGAVNGTDEVYVFLGDGTGGFFPANGGPYTVGGRPLSLVIGDLNNDGALDIVTGNWGSYSVSILLGDGMGGFTSAGEFGVGGDYPNSVALGDLNGDSYLDIVTVNYGSDNVSVLMGDGTGNFGSAVTYAVGHYPVEIALGDLDGDSDLDIVTANHIQHDNDLVNESGPNSVSVLENNGSGNFAAPVVSLPVGNEPTALELADVDNDNDLDIVTANVGSNDVSVLLNQ